MRRTFEKVAVIAHTGAKLYFGGLIYALSIPDQLGEAGEGTESMVRNLQRTSQLEAAQETFTREVALTAQTALTSPFPWKQYRSGGQVDGDLSKPMRYLASSADIAAKLTMPVALIGSIALIAQCLRYKG